MALSHVDHFLIQAEDLEKTKNWYIDVLGMREGPHPDFKFLVHWLYIGDKDVIHMTQGGANVSENRKKYLGQQSEATEGSGVVDHIAFHAHDPHAMLAHFDANGVAYESRQVSDQGQFQLFMFDPNGVKIEINFPAEEAVGIEPAVMATDLKSE